MGSTADLNILGTDFLKQRVDASLAYGIARPDDRVEWTLWTSADDINTVDFKRQFLPAAIALGKHVKLTVRYFIRSGKAIGCNKGSTSCEHQCTNNGRYCAPDPDSDSFYGLDGEDIVRENLRQSCIFNVTSAEGKEYKWWQYVAEANAVCGNFKLLPDADKCKHASVVEGFMVKYKIDVNAVNGCIESSG
jgi:hypothetical protein